jgi:hypothetical protein
VPATRLPNPRLPNTILPSPFCRIPYCRLLLKMTKFHNIVMRIGISYSSVHLIMFFLIKIARKITAFNKICTHHQ